MQAQYQHGKLESVLRERTSALEISNLDWAKAFFNNAPSAKLALLTSNSMASVGVTETSVGLKPFVDLLQLNVPGLWVLMQDWLHNFYAADYTVTAFAERSKLPLGASFLTRQGHVISKTRVRFYAFDSE